MIRPYLFEGMKHVETLYCSVKMKKDQEGQDRRKDGTAAPPCKYEAGKTYEVSVGLARDLVNMGAADMLDRPAPKKTSKKDAGAAPENKSASKKTGAKKTTKKKAGKKKSFFGSR